MEKRDFFISYTKTDKEWAVWIADTLIAHGYTVYVQALDIGPGDNFIEKMNEFLKNSGNFIAVWSKAYSESRFCMTELQAAFNAWHKKRMDCFLPVRIDNHPMEPLYSALVHVDLSAMGAASAEKLVNAIQYAISSGTQHGNAKNSGYSTKVAHVFPLRVLTRTLLALIVCVFFAALLWEGANFLRVKQGIMAENMGFNYFFGVNGVKTDYVKARTYYERAVEKGNTSPLNALGWIYYNALGGEADYTKAKACWEQAAEKGSVAALNNLGVLYHNVEQDYASAMEYHIRAAEKGDKVALYNLGWIYEYGDGVDKDDIQALSYYQKSADKGDQCAVMKVAELRKESNN